MLISGGIGYVVGTGGTFEKTQTVTSVVLAQCSDAQSPNPIGLLFGAVHVGTSPATICVQLYYYNDSSMLTLNLSRLLSIDMETGGGGENSGASNFTIASSQNILVIGGPNSVNEGTVIAYTFTAIAGASGTYGLGIRFDQSNGGVSYMMTPQQPNECGDYGEIVASNGQPYYFPEGGCISYTVSYQSGSTIANSSKYHSIQGIQYPLLSGDLYFRVLGITNSTQ